MKSKTVTLSAGQDHVLIDGGRFRIPPQDRPAVAGEYVVEWHPDDQFCHVELADASEADPDFLPFFLDGAVRDMRERWTEEEGRDDLTPQEWAELRSRLETFFFARRK